MAEQKTKSDMKERIKHYAALVAHLTPKSRIGQGCFRAFWVGGAICVLGQAFMDMGTAWLGLTAASAASFASVSLVFLTALLTGVGVFDRIARDWGRMLCEGATTFWETQAGARDFDGAGSLCHGWSAVPIYCYFAYALGLKPAAPGFSHWEVKPVDSGLYELGGRVLLPDGRLLDTGARLFTIAGPVLVYGISASVIIGVLYYFIRW